MKIYTKTGDQGTTSLVGGGTGVQDRRTGGGLRLGGRIDRFRCPAYGPFAGRCGVGAPCLGARTHCLPVDDCCCYAGCGRRRSGQGERNRRRGCEVSRRGDRPYAGFREADYQVHYSGRTSCRFAVSCLPHGLPSSRTGGASGRCEVWRRTGGTDVPQPAVGLFLSAGPHADRIFQRGGNPVDSVRDFIGFFGISYDLPRSFFFVCRKDPTRPMRLKCR